MTSPGADKLDEILDWLAKEHRSATFMKNSESRISEFMAIKDKAKAAFTELIDQRVLEGKIDEMLRLNKQFPKIKFIQDRLDGLQPTKQLKRKG